MVIKWVISAYHQYTLGFVNFTLNPSSLSSPEDKYYHCHFAWDKMKSYCSQVKKILSGRSGPNPRAYAVSPASSAKNPIVLLGIPQQSCRSLV